MTVGGGSVAAAGELAGIGGELVGSVALGGGVRSLAGGSVDAWSGLVCIAGAGVRLEAGPAFAHPATAISSSTSRKRPVGR